jgi:hypothetical protein
MAKRPDRNGLLRVGAAAVVLCASLSACGAKPAASGTGGLGVASAPAASQPSANATPSASSSGPNPASTAATTTTRHTSKSAPPAGSVKVTVREGNEQDVVTTTCPYYFMMTGTISVDSGPADVVYYWLRDDKTKTTPVTLHFPGAGAQTMTVTDDDPETVAAGTVTDTIEVVGPFTEITTFRHPYLQCSASAATPTVLSKPVACPDVIFSALLTVPIGGQTAKYTWHFDKGQPDVTGQFTFAPGVTRRFVAVSKRISGSLTAWLQVTNGAGMTTARTTATCP